MATSVPQVQFTLEGLVLPDEAAILAGVFADINTAFGGGLSTNLETPQGQLASSITAVIGDENNLFAQYVNQVDPAYSAGRMQDAIGRIYFITRKPATPTAVQVLCVGLSGTIIPAGAQAINEAGEIFIAVEGGVIGLGGDVTLAFESVNTGPIPCPANTLNRIYQAIPGWDTVNNPTDGVPGSDVESRAEFEFRRAQSVALNAHGSLQSIYAAVFEIPDVLDVYVYENPTNFTANIGSTNFPLSPHSLYVAAVGGDPQEICKAIWLKKDVGCDYNGNTTRTVYDDVGYEPPYPAYSVKYQIPTSTPVFFAVQIANNANLPADIVAMTKAAIVAAFTGSDGGARARIGATIYASRYYCSIAALSPLIGILSLTVGLSASPVTVSVLMGIDQVPTLDPDDIAVTIV